MYADRIDKYKLIENEFDGKLLSYINSDRPLFETKIAQDAIDIIIDQLDNIGNVKRLILYLYTRGGDTAAAWNIVNLLRMYCDELYVIVPHKAHSAGTIISLGADKIIMTKQATLSPIDPSIITPLNPIVSNNQGTIQMPVSVEAVNGYIELAKEEFKIGDEAITDVMLKLADHVHPLVLGDVYRSRAQIRMLAGKLLKNQLKDDKKCKVIIDFLCGDSGSHDYTINRREANEWGLCVETPTQSQYEIIKDIYDNFSQELGFGQVFDPRIKQGVYAVRRSFIESNAGGSDYFVTEGRITPVPIDGKVGFHDEHLYEGWRKEVDSSKPHTASIVTEKGELQYEQDETFKL